MSFSDLVQESVDSIHHKIGSYNDKAAYKQRKCDYIEFLALLHSDKLFRENLAYRFYGKGEDILPEDEKDFDIENMEETDKSALYDSYESEFVELYAILKYRESILLDVYPFEIGDNWIKLKETLIDQNKLYLYLLCCSDISRFGKEIGYCLTDEFEKVVYCALENFLPNFTIKKLGSNSDYTGNTINKLRALGQDLNVPCENDQINEIDPRANKEKGVDIIAWYKFKDNIPNTMIYLVQCACGKDNTLHKVVEPDAYHTYFNFGKFKKYPIIILAIPKAVNTGVNHIEQIKDIAPKDSLYLDRFRIIELTGKNLDYFSSIKSFELINALIEKNISVLD